MFLIPALVMVTRPLWAAQRHDSEFLAITPGRITLSEWRFNIPVTVTALVWALPISLYSIMTTLNPPQVELSNTEKFLESMGQLDAEAMAREEYVTGWVQLGVWILPLMVLILLAGWVLRRLTFDADAITQPLRPKAYFTSPTLIEPVRYPARWWRFGGTRSHVHKLLIGSPRGVSTYRFYNPPFDPNVMAALLRRMASDEDFRLWVLSSRTLHFSGLPTAEELATMPLGEARTVTVMRLY